MGCSLGQQVLDPFGNLVSLAQQLCGRKLGDHCPQDFVAEGGEYLLLVVLAKPCVDSVEPVDLRVEEDSHGQLDALHVPIGSFCKDLVLPGLDVVDDWFFEEGELEVEPLAVDAGAERARDLIELDGVVADINYVRACVP